MNSLRVLSRTPSRARRASSTALPLCLLSVLAGAPARAQESPGSVPLRVELPAVTTRIDERFEVRLQVHTEAPVGVFALRLETAPEQVRIRSWSLGSGIERHIALHGEPPACDIIVYPDQSRMFAVMVMDPPFSSLEYGSEALAVEFTVEAAAPSVTCVLYSAETPDYEPGDDLGALISRLGAARRCAPVIIRDSPPFRRGDADGDGRVDLSDAVGILDLLFRGRRAPPCADAVDANDDGVLNLSDCILVLGALFQGSVPPWTACRSDRTEDVLPACEDASC